MAAPFLRYSWLASLSNLACTQPLRSSFCPTHKVATTLAGPLGLTLEVACPWPKVGRCNFLAGICQLWRVLAGLEKARIEYSVEHSVSMVMSTAFQRAWRELSNGGLHSVRGPLCHELCQFECSHPDKVLTSKANMHFSENFPSREP